MRDLLSKLTTGTMIAGAALLVSACGGTETATADNAAVAETNAMEAMGETNDAMTATDAAMGNDAMMANDAMGAEAMGNDAMANDAMAK